MNQNSPHVFAVLVTYRRQGLLAESLKALFEQHLVPHLVVVVDNEPSAESNRTVDELAAGRAVEYVAMATNVGPAGGRAAGLDLLLPQAGDEDWVVLLDDDDPLPQKSTLLRLYEFAQATLGFDDATAGVALRGACFDRRKARTLSVAGKGGRVRVDHLHGGFFPLYRAGAIRAVGTFDSKYFFGFEELDYGLRLVDCGYSLYVDDDHLHDVKDLLGHAPSRRFPRIRLEEPSWRRYYSLRNLSYILLQRAGRYPALRVAVVRGFLKPLLSLPLQPRLALAHLRLNWRAVRDAWMGRMFMTEAPVDPSEISHPSKLDAST